MDENKQFSQKTQDEIVRKADVIMILTNLQKAFAVIMYGAALLALLSIIFSPDSQFILTASIMTLTLSLIEILLVLTIKKLETALRQFRDNAAKSDKTD